MASRKKTRLAAAICAAAFALSLGTSAVFAGEITGNGKVLEVQGRSLCAYSGQNDEYHQVDTSHPRVQSWGQIPKAFRDSMPPFFHPGRACNPNYGLHE